MIAKPNTTQKTHVRLINRLIAHEAMPHGVCVIDQDCNLTLSNDRFWKICGLERQVCAEVGFHALIPKIADPELKEALLSAALRPTTFALSIGPLKIDNGQYVISSEGDPSLGYTILIEEVASSRLEGSAKTMGVRHDELTSLLDRTGFCSVTSKLLSSAQGEAAVLYIDLDKFKPVNDTLGHAVGDQVLQHVAQKLRSVSQATDIVARLSGDEFAILQAETNQPFAVKALAKRIISALNEPINIDEQAIEIGCSIGIANYPFDGTEIEDLLKHSDMALYAAKADGRGTFRFFEPKLAEQAKRRRNLKTELRRAIELKQFILNFQPLVDLTTNKLVSFEALVRWEHPTLGRVPPDQFIPLAEESGLIGPLGEWVLREACFEAASWTKPLKIAVNLSPVQLGDRQLFRFVRQTLDDSGLLPERLELEITETALMSDSTATLAVLHQLHDYGVRIALDDFGTGYSSINYLQRFPFDKIKIDRSFVSHIDQKEHSSALVKMIATLGATLGISTTAEGVETEAEREYVRNLGCTEVQGYLLSRPLSQSDVSDFIERLA